MSSEKSITKEEELKSIIGNWVDLENSTGSTTELQLQSVINRLTAHLIYCGYTRAQPSLVNKDHLSLLNQAVHGNPQPSLIKIEPEKMYPCANCWKLRIKIDVWCGAPFDKIRCDEFKFNLQES